MKLNNFGLNEKGSSVIWPLILPVFEFNSNDLGNSGWIEYFKFSPNTWNNVKFV